MIILGLRIMTNGQRGLNIQVVQPRCQRVSAARVTSR